MTESYTAVILAGLWVIFAALVYSSMFRSVLSSAPTGKAKGKVPQVKPIPKGTVYIMLAVFLVVRVILSVVGRNIADITSTMGSLLSASGLSPLLLKLPSVLSECGIFLIFYKWLSENLCLPKEASLILLGFVGLNPYSLIATASFTQALSVCMLCLFASFYLLLHARKPLDFLWSGLLAGAAFFLHTYALYFIPLLVLVFIGTLRESEQKGASLSAFLLPAVLVFILPMMLLGDRYVFLFTPSIGHSVNMYMDAPTANAFNFYSLFNSWKESWYSASAFTMDSRLFFLKVSLWGYIGFILSLVVTAVLYMKSSEKKDIFYYAGLLTLLLFTFVTGMEPLFILPATLFFLCDFAASKKKSSLLLGFMTSLGGLLNIASVAFTQNAMMESILPPSSAAAVIGSIIFLASSVCGIYYAVKEHTAKKEEKASFIYEKLHGGESAKLVRKDVCILLILTVIAGFMNFWSLGDTKAPSTMWDAATDGRETVVEVSGHPSRYSYFLSLGPTGQALEVKFSVETSSDGVNWTNIDNVSESGYCYTWYDRSLSGVGRFLKFTANEDYMKFIEIGLYEGTEEPLPVKVISGSAKAFDEQDLVQYGKTYMNSMYFDEVYHGRTAYEVTQHINEYEWTHPPLGKLLMSIGISVFGMCPFGWRFMGALFGVLLVPLMYLFGKKIFKRADAATASAFLMLFDNFRLAQTRIATIDTYGTFFIILMYYFMYDFYTMDFRAISRKNPWALWRPLLFSGISFGVGCAAKWIGIYAGGGLALLFFMALYRMNKESKKTYELFGAKTIGLCVLFFGVIPFAIYYASYLPHLSLFGYSPAEFFHQQDSMYSYHSNLSSTHSYSSSWYMWPFMIRPVYFCSSGSGVATGFSSRIAGIGNPFIWWFLVPAFIFFIFLAFRKLRDHRFSFLIIGFLTQYLPWVLISRTTYQYHFFASLPFLFAMLVYGAYWLGDYFPKTKKIRIIYAALVILFFILYLPPVLGINIPSDSKYFEMLKAFDSWNFF